MKDLTGERFGHLTAIRLTGDVKSSSFSSVLTDGRQRKKCFIRRGFNDRLAKGNDMIKVRKKAGNRVKAYRLGDSCPELEQLMKEGKIIPRKNGFFEVMSQEAVRGNSGKGEVARTGDYVKLDSFGYPYPNDAAFFYENHVWITGNEYEQVPRLLDAWTADEPMCEEIAFLISEKGLEIHKDNPENYFSAMLWETKESASRDAVVVFYSIIRDESGNVLDASYNFVCRSEFEKNYDYWK